MTVICGVEEVLGKEMAILIFKGYVDINLHNEIHLPVCGDAVNIWLTWQAWSPGFSLQHPTNLVMVHMSDPSTLKVEAGGPESEGHPQIHAELETSLGYSRLCQRKKKIQKICLLSNLFLFYCYQLWAIARACRFSNDTNNHSPSLQKNLQSGGGKRKQTTPYSWLWWEHLGKQGAVSKLGRSPTLFWETALALNMGLPHWLETILLLVKSFQLTPTVCPWAWYSISQCLHGHVFRMWLVLAPTY